MIKRVLLGVGLVFGFFALLGSWKVVPPGHRGIVIHAGKVQDQVLGEGLSFKVPFYTTVKTFPVRVEESTIQTQAASKDMQKVHTTLSINWHIMPEKVNDVFKRLGEPEIIQDTIIKHSVSEVLKAETSKFSAEEILAKRTELKNSIDSTLIARLSQFDITVDMVNLSDFDFEPEYNKAIEEKQVAEQNSKKAEYVANQAKVDARAAVNKAQGEADSQLLRAKAQAESQRLLQASVTPQILQLKAIEKWSGEMPQVLGNGGQMLFNIPTSSKGEK